MRSHRAVVLATLVCVAAMLAQPLEAQTWEGPAAFGVRITNEDGEPVAGAQVVARVSDADAAGPAPIMTDAGGRAIVSGLLEGEWFIEVSHPGYMLYAAYINLRAGKKPVVGFSSQVNTATSWAPMTVKFQKATADFSRTGTTKRAEPKPPTVIREQPSRPQPEPPKVVRPEPKPPKVVRPQVESEPQETVIEAQAADEADTAEQPEPPQAEVAQPEATAPETAAPEVEQADIDEPEAEQPPMAVSAPTPAVTEPTPDVEAVEVPTATATATPEGEATVPTESAAEPQMEPSPSAPAPDVEPEVTPSEVAAPQPTASEPDAVEESAAEVLSAPSVGVEPAEAAVVVEPVIEDAVVEADPSATVEDVSALEPETPAAEPSVTPPAETAEAATEPPAEPEATAVEERAAKPSVEAAPPEATGPTSTAQLPRYLRSAAAGTCSECQPDEWAVSAEQEAARAGDVPSQRECTDDYLTQVGDAAQLLADAPASRLTDYSGPVLTAMWRLEAGASRERLQDYLGTVTDPTSNCQMAGVVLPAGATFSGYVLEAWDRLGGRACRAKLDCAVGQARWISEPQVVAGAERTVVYTVFKNRSTRRERRLRMTIYFKHENGDWSPRTR